MNIIYLNDIFNPKKNSFTFLRFLLASLVVFSHSYPIGGFGSEAMLGSIQESYGGFAVCNFFVLSGFLITRSYSTTNSIWKFLLNRILRIFPGFFTCLLVTILIFAPTIYLVENNTLNGYFNIGTDNPIEYLKANFFLEVKQYGIANLLLNNPYPKTFNGSIWTLIYEFKCYIFVGFLGVMGIIQNHKKVCLYLFLFLWFISIFETGMSGFSGRIFPYFSDVNMVRLPMYFLAGATYFLFQESIVVKKSFFAFAVVLTIFSIKKNFYLLIAPVTLPYILFYLAFKLPFTKFDKYGGFSYGLYIYAFPIQQMLSFFGLHTRGFLSYFTLSMAISIILSILSFYLVEKPFLQLKEINYKNFLKPLKFFVNNLTKNK